MRRPDGGSSIALRRVRGQRQNGRVTITAADISERRRVQDALRKSQSKFQALIETTSDFIWEIDSKGKYTYCTPPKLPGCVEWD